ncbi:MAG: hypothetical protein GY696_08145 [Gammaproteobacteria bacterium]|nr:hypothetical protein [Gammaproteobacteria bacterium]
MESSSDGEKKKCVVSLKLGGTDEGFPTPQGIGLTSVSPPRDQSECGLAPLSGSDAPPSVSTKESQTGSANDIVANGNGSIDDALPTASKSELPSRVVVSRPESAADKRFGNEEEGDAVLSEDASVQTAVSAYLRGPLEHIQTNCDGTGTLTTVQKSLQNSMCNLRMFQWVLVLLS